MGDTGLEPSAKSSKKTALTQRSAAKCAARGADNGPIDADLTFVIERWPGLSEPIKAGILAMIRSAGGAG